MKETRGGGGGGDGAKIDLAKLLAQPSAQIVQQMVRDYEQLKGELLEVLTRSSSERRTTSRKAHCISKAQVACAFDFRDSVIRRLVFLLDVCQQVPRDLMNGERIEAELDRLRDEWTRADNYFKELTPLLGPDGDVSAGSVIFWILALLLELARLLASTVRFWLILSLSAYLGALKHIVSIAGLECTLENLQGIFSPWIKTWLKSDTGTMLLRIKDAMMFIRIEEKWDSRYGACTEWLANRPHNVLVAALVASQVIGAVVACYVIF